MAQARRKTQQQRTKEWLGWASGKRKPRPGAKHRRKPIGGKRATLVSVILSVITLALLAVGLILESFLIDLVGIVAALGSLAQIRAQQMDDHLREQAEEKRKAQGRHEARQPRKPREPAQPGNTRGVPSNMHCTRTGEPVGENVPPDQRCHCSSRGHVITREGLDAFGGQFGDPIGAKNRKAAKGKPRASRPERVPTTNNAKPRPPGHAMQKQT